MKVIIIGGVAGGASAAARLRRLDEKAEIAERPFSFPFETIRNPDRFEFFLIFAKNNP